MRNALNMASFIMTKSPTISINSFFFNCCGGRLSWVPIDITWCDLPGGLQHISALIKKSKCHCSSWWTSLFVTGHVSIQFSGYLLLGIFLPLMSVIGKMEWNLIMSATESNTWGETRWVPVSQCCVKAWWTEFAPYAHISRLLCRPQDVLFRTFDKPYFHIVNLLLVVHGQHQRFTDGVHGAVSYQKCPILIQEERFRHVPMIWLILLC